MLLRVLIVETQTHPFAVVRAGELDRWVKSGTYGAILAGDYPRREDDASASMSDEVAAAAASYTEEFKRFDARLGGLFGDIGHGWARRATVADRLRDLSEPRGRDRREPRDRNDRTSGSHGW